MSHGRTVAEAHGAAKLALHLLYGGFAAPRADAHPPYTTGKRCVRKRAFRRHPASPSGSLPNGNTQRVEGARDTAFPSPGRDPVGGSSNGRTADSDSAYRGSNPRPPAILTESKFVSWKSAKVTPMFPRHRALAHRLGEASLHSESLRGDRRLSL